MDQQLVFDWRNRQQTRAAVRSAIRVELNALPEDAYPQGVWNDKVEATWQFVFDRYAGPAGGASVAAGL